MTSTARDSATITPTHELTLVGSPDEQDEVRAYNAGIEAVLDYADAVDVWLDVDLIQSDHPEIARSIRSELEPADDDRYVGSPAAVREALSGLLPLTTIHRFVGLERLDARMNDRVFFRHVPDHHVWSLDASTTPDLVGHVRDAIGDETAVLLPAETIAEWQGTDGTRYELSPPSLCIDGTRCLGLGALVGIEIDDDRREIRLDWAESGGVLGRVVSFVVPDRPGKLQFESAEEFREVADAFEPLADQFS